MQGIIPAPLQLSSNATIFRSLVWKEKLAKQQEENEQPQEQGQPYQTGALSLSEYGEESNDSSRRPAEQHEDAVKRQYEVLPGRFARERHENKRVKEVTLSLLKSDKPSLDFGVGFK